MLKKVILLSITLLVMITSPAKAGGKIKTFGVNLGSEAIGLSYSTAQEKGWGNSFFLLKRTDVSYFGSTINKKIQQLNMGVGLMSSSNGIAPTFRVEYIPKNQEFAVGFLNSIVNTVYVAYQY